MTDARVHDPAQGERAEWAPPMATPPVFPGPGGMVLQHAYIPARRRQAQGCASLRTLRRSERGRTRYVRQPGRFRRRPATSSVRCQRAAVRYSSQFSNRSPGTFSKSRRLAVSKRALLASEIAAIFRSRVAIRTLAA
jgi:hypothetical protein